MDNMYILPGTETTNFLLNADGRTLEDIKDNSVQAIITDHPWDLTSTNTGGNRNFIDYNTFNYCLEDFKQKYRILQNGCYLVEFLPIETAQNWEYLAQIKQMAKETGFKYYCSCLWRKAKPGTRNTGRTTKELEQIIIWSKGKPRRLSLPGKPYLTANILKAEINMPINLKQKTHKAEKPQQLYKYLIENLTLKDEWVLDQFGGSCNIIQASNSCNRNCICIENNREFIDKAINRFNLKEEKINE